VPAYACLLELVVVERADPPQQVELVAEVRPHHLRAVRGDRELDASPFFRTGAPRRNRVMTNVGQFSPEGGK
jgi:hypothetical protein